MQANESELKTMVAAAGEAEATLVHEDHAAAHEHPDHRLFGFLLFLVSEGMLFVGLFAAYLAYRSVAPQWPPKGMPELEILLPAVNTIILLSSSFVIHQAETAVKKGDLANVRKWFGFTVVMGAMFLAGQLYEYAHLQFKLQSGLFGGTFFVLTGFHGMHVLIGLVLMMTVIARSLKPGHYTAEKHFGVEAASLYWHFVDVVWIVLFLLLYVAK